MWGCPLPAPSWGGPFRLKYPPWLGFVQLFLMAGEPEFCICFDSVFPGLSEDALKRNADLTITRFEFWDWRERDVDALARESSRRGFQAVIFSGNTFEETLVDPRMRERAMAHLSRSSGTIPWHAVMHIIRDGYHGAIGLACWPTTTPETALQRCLEVLQA